MAGEGRAGIPGRRTGLQALCVARIGQAGPLGGPPCGVTFARGLSLLAKLFSAPRTITTERDSLRHHSNLIAMEVRDFACDFHGFRAASVEDVAAPAAVENGMETRSMARRRRSDEPRHDFTAGPAVAPRDNPLIRTFEVFYQGFPTRYWVLQRAPVSDGIYQAFLGSEPIPNASLYDIFEQALEDIAEYHEYLDDHAEALVDRTAKPEPAPSSDNPLAWSLRSRAGSATEFSVWHEDADLGLLIAQRDDRSWIVTQRSEVQGESLGTFDSVAAALAGIILMAKALARLRPNA